MGKKKSEEKKQLIQKIKKFKETKGFEKMYLFGSYARGTFTKDSDVDIIIADKRFRGKTPAQRSKGLWIDWHTRQKIRKPVDFICFSPEEFEREKKKVSIVSEAVREGIEL